MEPLVAIDAGAHRVLFWLLVTVGVALGVVVYAVLRWPGARRSQFRGWGRASPAVAVGAALLVAAPVVAYAYRSSWSHFYRAGLDGAHLVLGYETPVRTVVVAVEHVAAIEAEAHDRKSGPRYRIVVMTRDGERFTSQLMAGPRAESSLEALRAGLGQPR